MLQIKFPPEEDLAIDLDELSGEDRAILLSAIPFILGVKEAPKSLGALYAAFGNSTKVVANTIETAAQSKEAALPQFSTILANYVALGGAVSRIFVKLKPLANLHLSLRHLRDRLHDHQGFFVRRLLVVLGVIALRIYPADDQGV